MSALPLDPRPGFLERLTSTTLFAALFGVALFVAIPLLGLGLLFVAMAAVFGPEAILSWGPFALAVLGGNAGVIGWVRARSVAGAARPRGLTTTLVLLRVGCFTGIGALGWLTFTAVTGLQAAGVPRDPPLLATLGICAAALTVLLIGGLAWIARLKRRYRRHTGRPPDTVPAMFLIVALALAAGAVLGTALLAA